MGKVRKHQLLNTSYLENNFFVQYILICFFYPTRFFLWVWDAMIFLISGLLINIIDTLYSKCE